jgi:nucleoside-diphosphate-sugar epimerase
MAVLVTGGSGYFGSLLLARLAERTREPLRNFDRVEPDDPAPGVEFVRGDIRDAGAIARACQGVSIVHHNVAQVPLARDRRLLETVNVQGTENLLRAARQAGVRKLVYTSSSAVYGVPDANPVTEATLPAPREPYGRAKYEGERRCLAHARAGLDVTIVRPRTILGHGRLGIFQILFEWVRTGYNVPVLGNGGNVYQFVHADDLADACIRAGERVGADAFNVGADRFGTMRELLEGLCAHAATGSRVRGVPAAPAEWLMKASGALGLSPLAPYHALMYGRSMYFDVTKAKSELGWQPRYSNHEMIVDSYDWYLRNRESVLAGGGSSRHRSAVRQGVLDWVKRLL